MRNLMKSLEIVVGGAPSLLQGPKQSDGASAVEASPLDASAIPFLPAVASCLAEGSRSVRVYFPQGLLRRPMAESDVYRNCVAGTSPLIPHVCQGGKSMHEMSDVAPYPGDSLFQESFFFCTIKNVGDDPGAGDIYIETAVEGNCRLAFAKVYSAQNAINAVDLLTSRVVPFFKDHGVGIERVFTPKSNEYCGLAPAHPFETFLATSHIQHLQMDRSGQTTSSLCEQFYRVLQREFFSAALRKRFHQSLGMLQQDLDAFVETYNSERTGFELDPQDRPPLRAFLDAATR